MSNSKFNAAILPVMFGFFIMGFVDIVGVATNYVKADLSMGDSVVNLISISCFLWFLVLSIPVGMLMNKIGRKKTVILSFAINAAAMLVPLFGYNFTMVLLAFGLMGIGNTILQVALNPLVSSVVSADKLTGSLGLGQFTKAVSSFLGPILVAWFVGSFMGWKLIFPVYSAVSILAMVWLAATPVKEVAVADSSLSFGRTFSLLKDRYIILFFAAILVLVGVDVGMGITFPKLLQERCGLSLENAGMGNSVYFAARTVGAFLGGILLMKWSERKFFAASAVLALLSLVGIILSQSLVAILVFVAIFGLGYSNLFAIVFSLSLQRVPEKSNEVSALLIVGVSGGAIIPPVLGLVTDSFGNQGSALIALGIVWIYMLAIIPAVLRVKKAGE